MDPIHQIDFIRSHEVNVPWEGFKGAVRELFHEGPLTILFAAAVGAAIGGLMIGGAALSAGGVSGLVGSAGIGSFITMASAASAALTTLFVGARGYLEGRHDALEKNILVQHEAEMLGTEITLRGKELNKELTQQVTKTEGSVPDYVRAIIESGKRGSPGKHAETILAQQEQMASADLHR